MKILDSGLTRSHMQSSRRDRRRTVADERVSDNRRLSPWNGSGDESASGRMCGEVDLGLWGIRLETARILDCRGGLRVLEPLSVLSSCLELNIEALEAALREQERSEGCPLCIPAEPGGFETSEHCTSPLDSAGPLEAGATRVTAVAARSVPGACMDSLSRNPSRASVACSNLKESLRHDDGPSDQGRDGSTDMLKGVARELSLGLDRTAVPRAGAEGRGQTT